MRITGGEQMRYATSQHPCLTRACSGDDEQWATTMFDRGTLGRVQIGDESFDCVSTHRHIVGASAQIAHDRGHNLGINITAEGERAILTQLGEDHAGIALTGKHLRGARSRCTAPGGVDRNGAIRR